LGRIGDEKYIPTHEDILRARTETRGIIEKTVKIEATDWMFVDFSGQRNDKRKWLYQFQNFDGVFFITSVADYDKMISSDDNRETKEWREELNSLGVFPGIITTLVSQYIEEGNALQEAIRTFDDFCHHRYFNGVPFTIFLNKVDLFKEKIKTVPLSQCFPEYTGNNSFESACDFIEKRFLEVNQARSEVYIHYISLIDSSYTQKVFMATEVLYLRSRLEVL